MIHGRKYYVHIVETGQTVYSISRAYKVESYDAVTHQDIHFLHAGDTVWLPCRGQFSEGADADTPAQPEATAPATEATTPASKPDPTYRRPANGNSQSTSRTSADAKPSTAKQGKATGTDTKGKPTTAKGKGGTDAKGKPSGAKATAAEAATGQAPTVRQVQGRIKVAVMMPLHLNQIDQISTTRFDVEQRGKRSYKQFEFIEFYEGILLALDHLEADGVSVELNVVDVGEADTAAVARAFSSHHVGESDVVVALLLRDAFAKAAALAREAGVYIVNPMATRGEICAENPFVVKTQPSLACQLRIMLANMHLEHPSGHLIVLHSGAKAEKAALDEVKSQLDERGDMPYTLFNWSQSAKLAATLKQHPGANVLSLYDQGREQNRIYVSSLLNKLSASKADPPTLYSLADLTREVPDIDFAQLQQLSYHTYWDSWDMTNLVHVDFLKEFRQRFGTEPTSSLAATAYDLMLYICTGLHRSNTAFWQSPSRTMPQLTQPIRLKRSGAGLENNAAQLFEMRDLRFIPCATANHNN